MKYAEHVSTDLLIRALDDELSTADCSAVMSHLEVCEECREQYRELGTLSVRIEALVSALPVDGTDEGREILADLLRRRENAQRTTGRPTTLGRRFGWGIAVAAGLAVSVVFVSSRHPTKPVTPSGVRSGVPTTYVIEGETFVAVPYSNPDLPMNTARIVQMQVPVSSLADAGLVFEPVSNQIGAQDRSVLADVLLGVDGEPLAIHVVGTDWSR
jgi:hypothetical protein